MANMESMIKSEIIRLVKREIRKISVPLARDIRFLKGVISQTGKKVSALQKIDHRRQKELEKQKIPLEATPGEVKKSRFSPRLIRSLRKKLGISQKELAILTGVTVGAVHFWESGKFMPKGKKRGVIVALRKSGRLEVRRLLEDQAVNR